MKSYEINEWNVIDKVANRNIKKQYKEILKEDGARPRPRPP